MLARLWQKRSPCTLLLAMSTGSDSVGNSMEVSQDINNICYPAIPVLGIYIKNTKTDLKGYLHSCVHCGTNYKSPATKTTYMSDDC